MQVSRWGDDQSWRRWRTRWTALSLPVTAMVLLMWGPATFVSIGVIPGLLGGVAQIVVLTNVHGGASDSYILRAFVASTLYSGLITVTLVAAGSIAPSAALLLLVILAATSPPCAPFAAKPPGTPCALVPGPGVHAMSDVELCQAWRRSFTALENARTVEERADLVQLRQDYLDELETRDGTALRAWLSSGARAAGGPEGYLAGER